MRYNTIYGIKCICSNWDGCNGCDTDEYLLDYFFSTREKAEENLVKDSSGPGYRNTYKVEEIELDKFITKPEYRKYQQYESK